MLVDFELRGGVAERLKAANALTPIPPRTALSHIVWITAGFRAQSARSYRPIPPRTTELGGKSGGKLISGPAIASSMDGHQLVLVEWEDSAQPLPSWQWLSDCNEFEFVVCRSVGWLVHDGDEVKALAPNIGWCGADEDRQVSGLIRIPARCIRKVTMLDEGRATSCADPAPGAAVLKEKPRPEAGA